jgi:hypothetical protein
MKKFISITALCMIIVVSTTILGWRGGWHHGGGGWGPAWGWGPSFGVTIPVGGGSSTKVVTAPAQADDPYFRYTALFPKANPLKNKDAYYRWLYSNYTPEYANQWWSYFINYRYNPYQASKPRPSAYFSVGTGYPYYGYPYYW